MLNKILLALIAAAILLNANTQNNQNIDCEEQFESCILKCAESNIGKEFCVEKCEMTFDKCLLVNESNLEFEKESTLEDYEKEYTPINNN